MRLVNHSLPAKSTTNYYFSATIVDMKTIGQRLKESRIEAGLTQEQLGESSGLTKQAISGIERGETKNPNATTIDTICAILIIELEKSGWSLVRIGKCVGLSPQAISDLKQGYSKEPRGMAAVRLYKLHKNYTKITQKLHKNYTKKNQRRAKLFFENPGCE